MSTTLLKAPFSRVLDAQIQPKKTKGVLRFAVDAALSDPSGFGRADAALIASLGSIDLSKGDSWGPRIGHLLVERSTDVRLPLVLLAQVAAAVESQMSVQTWRNASYANRERAYLSFLAEQGYTLSAVEQLVVDGGTKPKARRSRKRRAATVAVIDGGAVVEDSPTGEDGAEGVESDETTDGPESDDVA